MRICLYCTLTLFILFGVAFCQETNFATGPQYLMTHGSLLFARPISTPSLSLAGPLLEVGASNATGDLSAGAQTQTVPASANSLSSVTLFPIYYGTRPVSVIEISFRESSPPSELPASILDTGVGRLTTAEGLRERGYGLTLPEAAAYGKARIGHAAHLYTNSDIDRLHNNN